MISHGSPALEEAERQNYKKVTENAAAAAACGWNSSLFSITRSGAPLSHRRIYLLEIDVTLAVVVVAVKVVSNFG